MSVRENITSEFLEKFRACPFCGGMPEITKEIYDNMALGEINASYVVSCKCGAKLVKETINGLISLWNGDKATTKILYVEDGSIDVDELKSFLPDSTKVIVVHKGSALPTEYKIK